MKAWQAKEKGSAREFELIRQINLLPCKSLSYLKNSPSNATIKKWF